MRKLIGPHLGGQWTNNLEILRKWQPPFVLVLQPELSKVQQLREACPQAIIVGRFFHDDSHYASNIMARPEAFAREIHNEIAGNPVTLLLDYAQSNNEVCQGWEGIQKLNQFTQEWMFLADQSSFYKCAILAFSVGNPDLPHKPGDPAGFDGRMLYWQQVLPSLNYAQQKNHLLLLHAYGFPNMFAPDADWYIYRYERQVQSRLRALGITNLKYVYGEIGIDRLIVGEKGGYKVVPTTDEGYVNQHLQWERDLQGEDLLLGGAIFTLGDSGGWGTYDIASANVASLIAEHYVEHAGDYKAAAGQVNLSPIGSKQVTQTHIPAVSIGTSPVEPALPRQIDLRATQRGVMIVQPRGVPLTWRVTNVHWLDEQESQGRHHIYADVLDEQGKRLANVPLMVRWPDGEHRIVTELKPGEPYAANFPMSASRNEFSITVDGLALSEVVAGIGMGADTPGGGFNSAIHTSTSVVFELVKMPATQPTPSQPQPTPATPAFVLVFDGVNMRNTPEVTEGNIVAKLPFGEQVAVLDRTRGVDKLMWAHVLHGKTRGFIRDDLLGAEKPLQKPPPAPEQPQPVASGALDPLVLEAILQVESGGRTHGADGRPIIRFEAHIFRGRAQDKARVDQFFRFNADKPWTEQERRLTTDHPWEAIHTGKQEDEYDAFAEAQMLDVAAAHQSISIGAAQIMGFNHARIGYANAFAMYNAFKRSANAQTIGFINFILSGNLADAINRRDFEAIATKYNGSENVAEAAAKYRAAYEGLAK